MSNNDDFLAKAHAATKRLAASASVQQNATPQQAKIVEELAQDRPTIHAAITSFLSLVAARSLVSPEQQQQQQQGSLLVLSNMEALKCSRALLKAINATTMSANAPKSTKGGVAVEEYLLVAQLWNGLIASQQKPSRFLGRRAMKHAWPDVKKDIASTNGEGDEKLMGFVEEFERLLLLEPKPDEDNDAALVWDEDGGKAELQRRRERREKRAKEASHPAREEEKLPLIEELPEDNTEAVTTSSE